MIKLIHERLKQIREYKKMNQTNFAELLGMGQSTLGMMEVGKREILDRHIKTICLACEVNEDWLRTGKGTMFANSENKTVDEISTEYNLSPLQAEIIKTVLKMPNAQRDPVVNFILALSDALSKNASENFDYEDFEKTQSFKVAAREGKDTINLTKEQREKMVNLVANADEPPDGVY